jgi:hypothetical protein
MNLTYAVGDRVRSVAGIFKDGEALEVRQMREMMSKSNAKEKTVTFIYFCNNILL